MPDVDPNLLEMNDPSQYFDAYFSSNFHLFKLMTRRLLTVFDLVADPAAHARVLQIAARPIWSLMTDSGSGQGTEDFADTLHRSLHRIGATLVFSPNEYSLSQIKTDILLSHHTTGMQKGVWHYKMAYLPHMFHVDRCGYSGWSTLAKNPNEARVEILQAHADWFFNNIVLRDRTARISKYEQSSDEPELPKNFIFFPLQIHNDSVISLCFQPDYLKFVQELIACALEQGETIVYKLHPFCEKAKFTEAFASIASDRLIPTNASIHEIIPRARAVLTANSGVGFEALTYLKHVICFGKADYASAAIQVHSVDEFRTALQKLHEPVNEYKIKQLLYIAMRLHQVDVRGTDRMDRHVLRMLCEHFLERS
jgi:hypothetical protein